MKREKIVKRLMIVIFIPFLCFGLIINLIWPDKSISTTENRSLQMFPAVELNDIKDGTFSKNVNNWFTDQFVGRDTFIHSKYLINKLTGMNKVEDVYLGKGALIEESAVANENQLNRNLAAINTYFDKYPDVHHYFMLVPNAVSIQDNKLPIFCKDTLQSEQMDMIYSNIGENITKIDIRNALSKVKDDYLYYKTDHHWTSLGAFNAFKVANPIMGNPDVPESDYTSYTVSTSFKGTLAHRVGSISMKDSIDIYVAKNNPDYICTNVATNVKSRSIYSVDDSNRYEVFFGGNAACIRIETNAQSNKHLLIFKDSYANAYVQFLLPYYRTITIVDSRYYMDNISRLMECDIITDVLYLYNTNTFVQDTSLADVIGG